MLISVRDVNGNTKNAAIVAGLIGGITAVGKSKKTLILQFTAANEISVLDMLSGADIKRNSLQSIVKFTDDGLDGIAIRADSNDLIKEHFDECATDLLEKDNMLDVLKPTKSENYREVLSKDVFENIIQGASEVYEYVYVILPNTEQDPELVELVTAHTDEDLVVISQGPKADVDLSNKKTNLVVINYGATSKFDLHSMRKAYGVKKLFTVPYSVACRDARVSESLLDYIIKNRKDQKFDDNYDLFQALYALVERYVVDKEDDEEEELEERVKEQPLMVDENPVGRPQDILPEDAVQEVIVRKKGLFAKKEKKIMINL